MVQALPQYDYLFGIGMVFAFLDAWNIGANDVANSFATSVSSRSLTLIQAMSIGSCTEFVGALTVGARVADTIRSKIIKVDRFTDHPEVLMLGMVCALVGSSTWLTIATKMGLPVSTTHCIVGGVIGMGIASLGAHGVNWGWANTGVSQVFASWFIAPLISGIFAAIIFMITKYGVLLRRHPLRNGLYMVPFYFALTTGILTMLIVWKGAASVKTDALTDGETIGTILGVAFGVFILVSAFFMPYLYRKLVLEDWQLRWYDMFYGPFLLWRGAVPPNPSGSAAVVQDYYSGHATRVDVDAKKADVEQAGPLDSPLVAAATAEGQKLEDVEKKEIGPWWHPQNLPRAAWNALLHGVTQDVVAEQRKQGKLAGDVDDMHARAARFDNKTEHLYSSLQVLTAATMSFCHGANDISNAVAPISSIYLIWQSGQVSKKAPVPIWVLVYCSAALVIGLWTYGYKIMRNLGNRLTLHSPTRGFSMELGSALTVVFATRLSLPVSTTQCILGATIGVAMCNGDLKSMNWRMVAWCYFGWILTLPIAGLIAYCLMAVILHAPHW